MSLRVRVTGLLAAVVGVGAYLLLASGGARSATEPVTASEQAVIARVAAFQRAEEPGDAIPGNTTLTSTERRIGPAGSSEHEVWASLSEQQLCVQVGEDGASACVAPEGFTRALIVGSSRRGPDAPSAAAAAPQQLAGVVRDGIASVTVLFAGGASETAPVIDNGFYLDTDERAIRQFDWTTSSGEVIDGAEVR